MLFVALSTRDPRLREDDDRHMAPSLREDDGRIPAFAGMTKDKTEPSKKAPWVPAYAGMTRNNPVLASVVTPPPPASRATPPEGEFSKGGVFAQATPAQGEFLPPGTGIGRAEEIPETIPIVPPLYALRLPDTLWTLPYAERSSLAMSIDDEQIYHPINQWISQKMPLGSRLFVHGQLRSENAMWTRNEAYRFDLKNPEMILRERVAMARQSMDMGITYQQTFSGHRALVIRGSVHAEWDAAYDLMTESRAGGKAAVDAYHWLVQPRESFIAYHSRHFHLGVGNQYIVWGSTKILNPLDIVSAVDYRYPFHTTNGASRLPVLSTVAAYTRGKHDIELSLVHQGGYGRKDAPFGIFSVYPPLIDEQGYTGLLSYFGIKDIKPSWHDQVSDYSVQNLKIPQAYLRWSMRQQRRDGGWTRLGFFAAETLHRQGIVIRPDGATLVNSKTPQIEISHPRYYVLGHSGDLNWRVHAWNFSLRWQAMAQLFQPVNIVHIPDKDALEAGTDEFVFKTGTSHNLIGVLGAGFEKSSFSAALELQYGIPVGGDRDQILYNVNELQYGTSVRWGWLKNRLILGFSLKAIGATVRQGGVARLELTGYPVPNLAITLGYVGVLPGRDIGRYVALTDHDQAVFAMKYLF